MRTINLKRNQPDHPQHREFPHSVSTNQIHFTPFQHPTKTTRTEITINTNQLAQQIKHYQWRQKTQFPIVKVHEFCIKQSNEYKTIIQVEHQQCSTKLDQLKDLPLFKILFLLKESIIGFQRLYDRFGSFKITSKMVALNQISKCKVWLNQNYSSNNFFKSFQIQKQFLNEIYSIFEERSNKLRNTSLFFDELKQFTTFCQALSFIQNYARQNKISIPKICHISLSEKITQNNEKSTKIFDPSLTMGRAPKFLNGHLRSNVKFEANSTFKDVMQRYSQKVIYLQESGSKNPQMKASGDTATGNSGKQTSYSKKNQTQLVDSVVFQQTSKEIKTKSFLPITNIEKKTVFSRKFSNQDYEINCFTPGYQKKLWEEECHHVGLDWNDAAFLNDEQEDDQVTYSALTETVFNKNNWQKTINGLFHDGAGLKKSVHEGKQVRNLEVSTRNLKLLQGFGKALNQSCINGQ